jgi:hypothetical protein
MRAVSSAFRAPRATNKTDDITLPAAACAVDFEKGRDACFLAYRKVARPKAPSHFIESRDH